MEEATATESSGYGKKPVWQLILIYLVIGALVYGAIYYFIFAKKGGGYGSTQSSAIYPTSSQPTAMTKPTEAMMAQEMKVNLASENNSSESGTATLTEANGKTTVVINLTGFTQGVSQPAHIHVGACPGVGAVKYPLSNVVNGTSSTILPVTLAQLKKELPLAINVHKSALAITNYTACGELK